MILVSKKIVGLSGETTHKRISLQVKDLMRAGVPDRHRYFEIRIGIQDPKKNESFDLYLLDQKNDLALVSPVNLPVEGGKRFYEFKIQKKFLEKSFLRVKFSDGKYYKVILGIDK